MEEINILIAADSYKGSMSSLEVANSIELGIKSTDYKTKITKIPIADGGEGTVEAVTIPNKGEIKKTTALSAMGSEIDAIYGLIDEGKTAILEVASPLGLDKLKGEKLDPNKASSKGLGQLIKFLLDRNIRKFYIGLGGSATNDAGYGMLKELGIKFLDNKGKELNDDVLSLIELDSIDLSGLDYRIKESDFILLSDVTNELCGKNGATETYGPQKGVKKEDVKKFDKAICKLGNKLEDSLNRKFVNNESAGAAGGLGAAFIGVMNAEVNSGIDKILELIDFEKYLENIDLVITGEGRMDFQSVYGKAPIGIAKLCEKFGKPVIAIVGSTGKKIEEVYKYGIDLVIDTISEPMSLEKAMKNSTENIKLAAVHAIHAYNLRYIRRCQNEYN